MNTRLPLFRLAATALVVGSLVSFALHGVVAVLAFAAGYFSASLLTAASSHPERAGE